MDYFASKLWVEENPLFYCLFTVKGKGVPFMEGTSRWHGKYPDYREYKKAVEEIRGNIS